jgi:type II secretory pathway predicted ATPase ExeA
VQHAHLKFFGLREPAFDLAPDAHFFFANRGYQEAFLAIRYGVKLRSGIIVVTGASGIGKTTLIRMVKERCESNTHICELTSSAEPSSTFLPRLLRALGILKTAPDRQAMLQQLRRHLTHEQRQDRITAVVLDDAHELAPESVTELESLSMLRAADKNLLQIILLGRPELEAKLENPGLASFKQRVALRYRVEPLRGIDVGRYIDHRLECAGYPQRGLFRPAAVELVASYSRGIPGLINAICEGALCSAYSAGCSYVNAEIIGRVWQSLQRHGENEFEVAALLSQIRGYSRPAEASGRRARRARRTRLQWLPLAELPKREALHWLAALIGRSWHQVARRLGLLLERARQGAFSTRS